MSSTPEPFPLSAELADLGCQNMVRNSAGPYSQAALKLLEHAAATAPQALSNELWRLHRDLSALVAALGRLAPKLFADDDLMVAALGGRDWPS